MQLGGLNGSTNNEDHLRKCWTTFGRGLQGNWPKKTRVEADRDLCLTSQWSGRLRAAHSGAAHRRVRRRAEGVLAFEAAIRQERAWFRYRASKSQVYLRMVASLNALSNVLRYLFYCWVCAVIGKARAEH